MFDNYLRNVTNLKKIVLILHLNDQRYHMSEAYDNILCQVPTYKALNSTIQVFFCSFDLRSGRKGITKVQ